MTGPGAALRGVRFAKVLRPIAVSILMLCACACEQPRAPAEPPASPTAQAQQTAEQIDRAAVKVTTLAGAWRVAGIDGRSLDEPYGLALTGNDEELWWEPRCAGMVRRYRIEGTSVSFRSLHSQAPAGTPPPPVCVIGLPPRLSEVFRALDAGTSIERTPANGIEIRGGGHSLVLFSQ